jgi:murein DD-endopeptidase MepM/ murein hydrolase activator NlpD
MTYVRPLQAMGGTPVDTAVPEPGDPQPPIYPLEIGSHGGWLEVRSTSADGSCGVHGYPCQHPGVDVAGVAGTQVVAPETGQVVMVGGDVAPFVGYGPWWILIQGESGKCHLLAHLEPFTSAMTQVGAQVTAGQVIGTTSSANHTHWEVRDKPIPDFANGETNLDNNSDPIAWLAMSGFGGLTTILIVSGAAALLWLLYQRGQRS